MSSWSKLLTASAVIFLLLQVSIPWINASSENLVTVSLTEAEEALASSYGAVLAAEQAGANVSGLFARLNIGGEYLSEAYVWYRLGDSANTNHFAGLCSDLVKDVRSDAVELRDEAQRVKDAENVITIFGSVVAVVVVVISCFVSWSIFKRNYRRRVLELSPEVVSDES